MTALGDDELVEKARKLVNPVVLVGDFDDDEDEMTPTYPPPSKHAANEAVNMLADRITALQARVKELEGENRRAWTQRNEAYAKVKAWEAVVYVEKLPLRAVPIDDWGPGGEGQTTVPDITPQKLTDLLDEIAWLRAALSGGDNDGA